MLTNQQLIASIRYHQNVEKPTHQLQGWILKSKSLSTFPDHHCVWGSL